MNSCYETGHERELLILSDTQEQLLKQLMENHSFYDQRIQIRSLLHRLESDTVKYDLEMASEFSDTLKLMRNDSITTEQLVNLLKHSLHQFVSKNSNISGHYTWFTDLFRRPWDLQQIEPLVLLAVYFISILPQDSIPVIAIQINNSLLDMLFLDDYVDSDYAWRFINSFLFGLLQLPQMSSFLCRFCLGVCITVIHGVMALNPKQLMMNVNVIRTMHVFSALCLPLKAFCDDNSMDCDFAYCIPDETTRITYRKIRDEISHRGLGVILHYIYDGVCYYSSMNSVYSKCYVFHMAMPSIVVLLATKESHLKLLSITLAENLLANTPPHSMRLPICRYSYSYYDAPTFFVLVLQYAYYHFVYHSLIVKAGNSNDTGMEKSGRAMKKRILALLELIDEDCLLAFCLSVFRHFFSKYSDSKEALFGHFPPIMEDETAFHTAAELSRYTLAIQPRVYPRIEDADTQVNYCRLSSQALQVMLDHCNDDADDGSVYEWSHIYNLVPMIVKYLKGYLQQIVEERRIDPAREREWSLLVRMMMKMIYVYAYKPTFAQLFAIRDSLIIMNLFISNQFDCVKAYLQKHRDFVFFVLQHLVEYLMTSEEKAVSAALHSQTTGNKDTNRVIAAIASILANVNTLCGYMDFTVYM